MTDDVQPRLIDLAGEAPFALGALSVRPATLEIQSGEQREVLEPRVMQVFVALARNKGEVVSRDTLNELCWGGRVVGDDAINRCIGRLRKLAQTHGGFEIETVPRVGFRLTEAATGAVARGAGGGRRLLAVAAVLVLIVAIAGAAWWALRPPPSAARQQRVALIPFQALANDPAARAFAAALADDIAGVMGEEAVSIATVTPAGGKAVQPGDLVLSGTVVREAGAWRVRAYLEDPVAKATVWSERFSRPAAEEAALRDQIAVAVTATLYDVQNPMRQDGLKLDPTTLALYLHAGNALQKGGASGPPGEWARALEQVVARAPQFAQAHGSLAVALLADRRMTPPAGQEALLARVEREARLGLKIDPKNAASSYGALWYLARARNADIAKAEQEYLLTPMSETDQPWLPREECLLQLEVGRPSEALGFCQRGNALRPLLPQLGYPYARALWGTGDETKARQVMDRMYRYFPDHPPTRKARFQLAAFGDSPERAFAMLDGMMAGDLTPEGREALRLLLRARGSGRAADADQALVALRTAARARRLEPDYVFLGAGVLGRPDDAFAAFNDPALRLNNDGGILFSPATAALRRDPRFWPIVARLGYVKYWRTRGVWPDFCADPAFNVDCPREAARVAPLAG